MGGKRVSAVYTQQETFHLGHEIEHGCQAKRGPAEQSLRSGLTAPALRGNPVPHTLHSLLSWHQSHQSLGFSSCYVKGSQCGVLGLLRWMGRWDHGPAPISPAALIDLVEQRSWLDFIQRKGSIALKKKKKFKNHKYQNQEK